jgi:alpha-N-acetylglucosaminidase
MLHNFGERPGMFGYLTQVANGPYQAMKQAGPLMQGIGLTMEGIHQNPVMYDFLTDQVWRSQPVDIDQWIEEYALRRYQQVPTSASFAWKNLRKYIYDLKNPQFVSRIFS